MRVRNLLAIMVLCLGMFGGLQPAKADTVDGVSFTLVQADLNGSPGDTLTWQYNVVNNSGFDIFANGVDSSIWSGGTGDASPFDFFAPAGFVIPDKASLLGGTLFSFISDPGVTNSFNSGVFDLFVQLSDPNGTVLDLTANYTATITTSTPVPEPSFLALLTTAVLAAAMFFALRRVQHKRCATESVC
jgi:hypothetical protein